MGKELSAQARSQYADGGLLQAPRGNILAADGSFLAANVVGWQLVANPAVIEIDTKTLAKQLAPILQPKGDDQKDADYAASQLVEVDRLTALLGRNAVWVPLASTVGKDQKTKIETLGVVGLSFEERATRSYPEASSAAQVLGFVGKAEDGSDTGYFGLEGYYDQSLSGKSGYLSRETDARGAPILVGDSKEVSAVEGVDLVTNIDKRVQLVVEKRLKEGIETYQASSGSIIVMEPKTGAIMAMASYPSFDPGKYADYGDAYFKNPAVSDSFEPGSVFKVLVMAAGLDAGVVKLDTKCDICSGPYKVDKYFINTWDGTYRPDSTMVDVIVHSDNVGMVYVANKLGIEKMYAYLSAFGIGQLTGIDLQGEFSAQLRPEKDWSIVDLAVGSFGQGVAVTPMQMLRAVGAIANNGLLPNPRVVKKLVGDGWEQVVDPGAPRRVISEQAAKDITTAMVATAQDGEAKWTYRRGFDVAAKTGTAQIPIAGHYDAEKTIASFVGFAPSTNPKFVMMVTLKEPQSSPWSSETAAPLWYKIADELFVYFGIQPK